MEASLRHHLIEMTAQFYEFHAASFDNTRQNCWSSWETILKTVTSQGPVRSVLDAGCGNGRFAQFMSDNRQDPMDYLGFDTSRELVNIARSRFPQFRFEQRDITDFRMQSQRFDLVACFGVLHHIPGHVQRADLMQNLVASLAVGGHAVFSFWQPLHLGNIEAKQAEDHGITGLEPNDLLLGWQGDFSRLRYCHHFDSAEIDSLVDTVELEPVARFAGNGNDRTNEYVIFANSANQLHN